MFKQTYDSMNERLVPGGQLVEDTLRRMADRRRGVRWVGPVKPRRFATAALALVLVLCISLTAAVAAAPGFRDMLLEAGKGLLGAPALAREEGDGLCLEVLGTTNTEDALSVYFTLQDKEKENRLSGNMDVIARLKLNKEFPKVDNELLDGAMWYNRVLHYDAETQTALCRMDFDTNDTYDVEGAQVKLSLLAVTKILQQEDYIPLDVSGAWTNPKILPVYAQYIYGSANMEEPSGVRVCNSKGAEDFAVEEFRKQGADLLPEPVEETGDTDYKDGRLWSALKPAEGEELFAGSGLKITGIGFVNSKFCVQVYLPGRTEGTPYTQCGIVCAKAGEGQKTAEKIRALQEENPGSKELSDCLMFKSASSSFFELDEAGRPIAWPSCFGPKYEEFYFEISPEELDEYEFFAMTHTSQQAEEEIQAEFPLGEELPGNMAVYGPMQVGDVRVDKLEITPWGVFLSGPEADGANYKGIGGVDSLELVCGDTAVPFQRQENSGHFQTAWAQDGTGEVKEYYTLGSVEFAPAGGQRVQEASALRINGAEIPLAAGSLWDTAGYEALWEQWVHITGVKATQEGVCLRGSRDLYDSVQSVSLVCGEEKLACTYDVSAGTSGSDTEEHWYKPEKAFDVKNVTAVEINGVEIPKASFLPFCGYEALWQAGMDISEITIIDGGLRISGCDIHDEKIETVEILCSRKVVACEVDTGGIRVSSGYAWDKEWEAAEELHREQSAIFSTEVPVKLSDVLGVRINGTVILAEGISEYQLYPVY